MSLPVNVVFDPIANLAEIVDVTGHTIGRVENYDVIHQISEYGEV